MKIYQTDIPYYEIQNIYKTCVSGRKTYYPDFDESKQRYNAISSYFDKDEPLFKRFYDVITKHDDSLKIERIQRAGVNLYLPNTKMYYHADGPVITALLYVNPKVNIEEGGETQFIVNDEIVSVCPKPGRLVIFDGSIRHTATSFSTIPRITLYCKFLKTQ
jgi:2OG-Fe(II) oxygenase superfamily